VVFTVRRAKVRPIAGWHADRRIKKEILFGTRNVGVMPLKKLVIPSFQSEREEAAWWQNHRVAVEADLRATLRKQDPVVAGRHGTGQAKEGLLPVTIRLANEDIATARLLSDDKGVGYQTYIKLLQHEALQKASRQTRRSRR
jgi:hypothetical protein